MKHILLFFALTVFTFQSQAQDINSCSEVKSSFSRTYKEQTSAFVINDDYDVKFYHLSISMSNTTTFLSASVKCRALVKNTAMDTFWLELNDGMTIDSITINNTTHNFTRVGTMVIVPLLNQMAAGSVIESVISYSGNPANSGNFFNGYSNAQSQTWGVKATWTLSEPFGAPDWFACKQDLRDKIDSVWIDGTCALPNKVGSNGMLVGVDTVGNNATFHWRHTYPIDFYLIAVACAPYIEYKNYAYIPGNTDSLLIQNWVYDAVNSGGVPTLQFFLPTINQTASMITVFSNKFGKYPFHKEKYGHMMAPLGGGMEHQTMTTLGSFSRDLVSHELGHQWFGDYVTCATWSDIWLNEGITSYTEYVFNESLNAATAATWLSNTQNSALNSTSGSVYVPAGSSSNRLFNSSLTYKKGASVTHMLRYVLGDSVFFVALKSYLQTYGFSTATTDQFRAHLELVSGKNLVPFFNQWIYGEGFPTYQLTWNQSGPYLFVKINHTTSAPTKTPTFTSVNLPIQISQSGVGVSEISVPTNGQVYSFYAPGNIINFSADPKKWILNGGINSTRDNLFGVGINQISSADFNIYPNPVKDVLNINTSHLIKNVTIYDITGKAVQNLSRIQNNQISTESLSVGIYILKIETDLGSIFQKLIKSND